MTGVVGKSAGSWVRQSWTNTSLLLMMTTMWYSVIIELTTVQGSSVMCTS